LTRWEGRDDHAGRVRHHRANLSRLSRGRASANAHTVTYDPFEGSFHGQFRIEEDFDAVALAHLIPEDGFERTIFLHVAVQLANGRVPAVNVHPPVPQHSLIVIQHLCDKE
jgi:hypothetical protein